MIAILAGSTVSKLRAVILRWMSAGAPQCSVCGIAAVDLISEEHAKERFSKLRDALQLIAGTDPPRIKMIRQEIRQIVFLESGPEYWPGSHACVLYDVRNLKVADVALHVIHETAHARLWRRGFRYDVQLRERLEHACVRSELRFLDKLPNSGELKREAHAKLEQRWWTTESITARKLHDLETLKAPRWMVRFLGRLSSR